MTEAKRPRDGTLTLILDPLSETENSVLWEVDMDFEELVPEREFAVVEAEAQTADTPGDPSGGAKPEEAAGSEGEAEPEAGVKPKKRRRRRKLLSPAHEARIEAYRALVEERGWIFSPPSPPQPVSALFQHLTDTQVESLSA